MPAATPDRILYLLKTRGALRAADLATALDITAMGARQHLAALETEGLVRFSTEALGRGRPGRVWRLAAAGHGRFGDRHADVTVMLIEEVRRTLGPAALEGVIAAHEAQQRGRYHEALAGAADARTAMERLAAARSLEGYMAEVREGADGDLLLIENHCPICVAAAACQGFCRAELAVFQAALAPFGRVEREEHLLAGARRCAYRLSRL